MSGRKQILYPTTEFETDFSMKEYLDTRFEDQQKNIDLQFKNINDKLDEISKQNTIRNGRIEKNELRVAEVDNQFGQFKLKCENVQEGKKTAEKNQEKRAVFNRWLVGIIVAILLAYAGWLTKKSTAKIPVELYYQPSDSTMRIPRMYIRDGKSGQLNEVHIDYFKDDIRE